MGFLSILYYTINLIFTFCTALLTYSYFYKLTKSFACFKLYDCQNWRTLFSDSISILVPKNRGLTLVFHWWNFKDLILIIVRYNFIVEFTWNKINIFVSLIFLFLCDCQSSEVGLSVPHRTYQLVVSTFWATMVGLTSKPLLLNPSKN